MERSPERAFGNILPARVIAKARKAKAKYEKTFGNDATRRIELSVQENPILGPLWGVKNLAVSAQEGTPYPDATSLPVKSPLVIGTIRMGYGHFRISMAIASAAKERGCTPLWFDMHSYSTTTAGKIIRHLNDLYSFGSRLSQKSALFNKFYWEPLNSEGFRKLEYNAVDQAVAELMAPVCKQLPANVPFVATHAWPAQAAVHAGMERVVNVIPDNWPMALHLSQGAIHAVQTPSSWLGYRSLNGMTPTPAEHWIPESEVVNTGHYVDHELVSNLEADCAARIARRKRGERLRVLISIGGAGAQKEFASDMLRPLASLIREGKIQLLVNTGDHKAVRDFMVAELGSLASPPETHESWEKTLAWIADGGPETDSRNQVFYNEGIFEAVYATNALMRTADVLVTKPSELSFYPIPKLMIKRIGGHEAWGAIRSAECGDGTPEIRDPARAASMLAAMAGESGILVAMNEQILRQKTIGTYDGAYKAVDIALRGTAK